MSIHEQNVNDCYNGMSKILNRQTHSHLPMSAQDQFALDVLIKRAQVEATLELAAAIRSLRKK